MPGRDRRMPRRTTCLKSMCFLKCMLFRKSNREYAIGLESGIYRRWHCDKARFGRHLIPAGHSPSKLSRPMEKTSFVLRGTDSQLYEPRKYSSIVSLVQVETPLPKKSRSSVQTGLFRRSAVATIGQSSSSREMIRSRAEVSYSS